MAIGFLSMTTPLEDRIDRWATSGNATRILLHPEDWDRLSDNKRERVASKYNLPVECLGGDRGYFEWQKRNVASKDFDLESETATVAANITELDDE